MESDTNNRRIWFFSSFTVGSSQNHCKPDWWFVNPSGFGFLTCNRLKPKESDRSFSSYDAPLVLWSQFFHAPSDNDWTAFIALCALPDKVRKWMYSSGRGKLIFCLMLWQGAWTVIYSLSTYNWAICFYGADNMISVINYQRWMTVRLSSSRRNSLSTCFKWAFRQANGRVFGRRSCCA